MIWLWGHEVTVADPTSAPRQATRTRKAPTTLTVK